MVSRSARTSEKQTASVKKSTQNRIGKAMLMIVMNERDLKLMMQTKITNVDVLLTRREWVVNESRVF